MVDLRKFFPALAVVAIALGMASAASAQGINNPALTCAVSSNPTTIRQEGFTELVGDVVITCTGGQPTFAGAQVPRVNITVSANTNITSRIYSDTSNEALLFIDEPAPEVQRACLQSAQGTSGCGSNYVGVYNSGLVGAPGANGLVYNSATAGVNSINGQTNPTIPNVWQGRYVTISQNPTGVLWNNVPVDPPGTNAQRTIRLTNIRVDATQIGVGLIPQPVQLTIQITPSSAIPLSPPGTQTVTVGFVTPGLSVTPGGSLNFLQCLPPAANQFVLTFAERFTSAFKNRHINANFIDNPQGPATAPQQQRFVNNFYFTESGFFRYDMPLVGTAGTNLFNVGSNNRESIGYASNGTRLAMRIPSLPAGVAFSVFNWIQVGTLYARLVTGTDTAGNGGTFTSVPSSTGNITVNNTTVTVGTGTGSTSTVTNGLVVYEIVGHDPFNTETLIVPMTVVYTTFPPALGSSTVSAGFAPFYAPAVGRQALLNPIPRFVDQTISGTAFQINACRTNVLFPYVSNQAGFDSGLAISNTSLDTGVFDTPTQDGVCSLFFYGNIAGGGAPVPRIDSQTVRAGTQLLYILSSGGNLGLTGQPGFQGYIIARCEFQYAHGFAYITDNFGATPRTAEGYIALILDENISPSLRRNNRWSISEILGH